MKIKFELNNSYGQPASHLSRGHITFTVGGKVYTSKYRMPDQSSMIFFAALEMLDLLIRIKTERSKKSYQFVATDSSFVLDLKHNDGELTFGYGSVTLGNYPLKSFALAFNKAVNDLFKAKNISMEDLGSLKYDFQDALDEFRTEFIE